LNILYTTLRSQGFEDDAIGRGVDYLEREKEIRRENGMIKIVKGGFYDE
jgi:hypothetical protein